MSTRDSGRHARRLVFGKHCQLIGVRALVRDWLLFILLGALLFRSASDEVVLPFRLFDFVFYYLVCTILVTLPARRASPSLLQPAEA